MHCTAKSSRASCLLRSHDCAGSRSAKGLATDPVAQRPRKAERRETAPLRRARSARAWEHRWRRSHRRARFRSPIARVHAAIASGVCATVGRWSPREPAHTVYSGDRARHRASQLPGAGRARAVWRNSFYRARSVPIRNRPPGPRRGRARRQRGFPQRVSVPCSQRRVHSAPAQHPRDQKLRRRSRGARCGTRLRRRNASGGPHSMADADAPGLSGERLRSCNEGRLTHSPLQRAAARRPVDALELRSPQRGELECIITRGLASDTGCEAHDLERMETFVAERFGVELRDLRYRATVTRAFSPHDTNYRTSSGRTRTRQR